MNRHRKPNTAGKAAATMVAGLVLLAAGVASAYLFPTGPGALFAVVLCVTALFLFFQPE